MEISLLAVTITFTNSLDLDQDRQNICPDLDPDTLIVCSSKIFLKKLILKKVSIKSYLSCKEDILKIFYCQIRFSDGIGSSD